jgi:hypothetical protein
MFAEEPRQNSGSPDSEYGSRVLHATHVPNAGSAESAEILAGRAYDNVRDRWAFIMVHFT